MLAFISIVAKMQRNIRSNKHTLFFSCHSWKYFAELNNFRDNIHWERLRKARV